MSSQYENYLFAGLSSDKQKEIEASTQDLTGKFDEAIDYLEQETPHEVFVNDGKVVAASFLVERGDNVYSPEIFIDPAYQRQGLGSRLFAGIHPHPSNPNAVIDATVAFSDPLPFVYSKGWRVIEHYGSGHAAIAPLRKGSQEMVPVFQRDPMALQTAMRKVTHTSAEYNNASRALKVWVDNLPYTKADHAPLPFSHEAMEDILLTLPLDNFERTFLWTQMNICSETPTPAPGPHDNDLSREDFDLGRIPKPEDIQKSLAQEQELQRRRAAEPEPELEYSGARPGR